MTSAIVKTSAKGFELTLTIPWNDVQKIYAEVVDEAVENSEITGFRKGKAPRELVLKQLDKGKIYGEVVNRILPQAYSDAVVQNSLSPIIAPKVTILAAEENKDWQFKAVACERPDVDLANYKDEIKGITAKKSIVLLGDKDKPAAKKDELVGEVLQKLLAVCQMEVPPPLLESEVSRQLDNLVDDVRGAGLTLEQYLASKNITSEQLQANFRSSAESSLKLEFILEAAAEDLKIEVPDSDVEAILDKESDQEKKKALRNQFEAIRSLLRREKTLTKLTNL